MLYQLNTSDDRPIYAQIGDQVKFAVAAGLLRPGEPVPSVRELARQLVVNPNTVARAYRDLQGEGVLESLRGIGLQVAQGATEACKRERHDFVRRRLRESLDEARRSNLSTDEIEAILLDEWARAKQEGGRPMSTPSGAANAIRIDGLTKLYQKKKAVDGVTFDVPVGSVFGLLGENGAGKSTTIKSILGLITADGGKVETLGLDPSRKGLEVRRKVGYVPEQPGLYDWMTVAEIGWFAAGFHPGRGRGWEDYQRRYLELMTGFDLPADRKIKGLSKGMRAKVGLALAMAAEPELLVLDEPTSGLDVLVRREFLESMVDLAGNGRTVLLSSHQIGEVERVASHVVLLHQGKLVLAEPLDELKARTFQVTFHLDSTDPLAAPPIGSRIELVDAADAPRQARWLVHADDRQTLEAARLWPGVMGFEVDPPSLEDIYIAYMRRRRPSAPAPQAVAARV